MKDNNFILLDEDDGEDSKNDPQNKVSSST